MMATLGKRRLFIGFSSKPCRFQKKKTNKSKKERKAKNRHTMKIHKHKHTNYILQGCVNVLAFRDGGGVFSVYTFGVEYLGLFASKGCYGCGFKSLVSRKKKLLGR